MVFRVRKLLLGHHNEDAELEKAVWAEILSTSPVDSTEASLQFTRKFILPKLGARFIETGGVSCFCVVFCIYFGVKNKK